MTCRHSMIKIRLATDTQGGETSPPPLFTLVNHESFVELQATTGLLSHPGGVALVVQVPGEMRPLNSWNGVNNLLSAVAADPRAGRACSYWVERIVRDLDARYGGIEVLDFSKIALEFKSAFCEDDDDGRFRLDGSLGNWRICQRGRARVSVNGVEAQGWEHPHHQVVELKGPPVMWLCLECGKLYEPSASGDVGDPKEWFIPAVVVLRADMEKAAGELLVPIPEPGTPMAQMLIANALLRNEVAMRLRGQMDAEQILREVRAERDRFRARVRGEEPESIAPVTTEKRLLRGLADIRRDAEDVAQALRHISIDSAEAPVTKSVRVAIQLLGNLVGTIHIEHGFARASDVNPFRVLQHFLELSPSLATKDVPALLEEIEALRVENAELTRALQEQASQVLAPGRSP